MRNIMSGIVIFIIAVIYFLSGEMGIAVILLAIGGLYVKHN